MQRRTLAKAALIALLAAAPAAAQADEIRDRPQAVIELFTSQGCSSCPPADALLSELARRPDVIALAYHVDYWDYIGWPDTFGDEGNSERQRAYAGARNSSRVYTPQLIVNGTTDVVASRERDVQAAIAGAHLPLTMTLTVADGMLALDVPGQAGFDDAVILLVPFIDRADVTIERGENAGKAIAYAQVVTERHVIGMWEPGAGARIKVPLEGLVEAPANGFAILIQENAGGFPGPILGAASVQP